MCAERSQEPLPLLKLRVFEEHSPFTEITPHMHMYCVYNDKGNGFFGSVTQATHKMAECGPKSLFIYIDVTWVINSTPSYTAPTLSPFHPQPYPLSSQI